jgi:DNA-binding beta-propeller fold protein YncE
MFHTARTSFVLDADSGAVMGDISKTLGVHGILLATDLGRGFITAGRANTIIIFDLKTLKTIDTVKSGGMNPDAVYYDSGSKRVFAFNGRSANAIALNAADGKLAGMITVGGKPELLPVTTKVTCL